MDAFRHSDDLAVELFGLANELPPRLYWLASQLMRAGTSAPSNIAEGYARSSRKEFLQYLAIARGSLAETEYFLHFMRRTRLLDDARYNDLARVRRQAAANVFGLIKSLRARLPAKGSYGRVAEQTEDYLPNEE